MSKYKFETLQLHAGHTPDRDTHSRAVPIYQTTSYTFEGTQDAADLFALKKPGNIYARLQNPTTGVLEERIAALEGGAAALAFSSGMGAITAAIIGLASAGDEIVSASNLYGGTVTLFAHTLRKLGINVNFVDAKDPENFRRAITPKTKALYAETLGNPELNILDIEAVGKIAREAKIPLIVDSTMTPPSILRPLEHGADIVVHSLTKYMGGHGTSLGGIVVDSGKFDWANGKFNGLVEPDESYHGLKFYETFGPLAYIVRLRVSTLRDTGAALSPFNAFLILLGVETLSLRMERHCENALKVAKWLEKNPNIGWVNYPGLPSSPSYKLAQKYMPGGASGMIAFGIKGGVKAGVSFINNVKLLSHLANIGDAKTLVIHPWTTTHQQLTDEQKRGAGITEDFIRLSVGIENADDIIADMEQALNKN
ncbi:MAG: O-acetylhomoserine aminocarboxypropyltransferase/cysteine synthase [Spirochaetia bacterium]|nr:O-acetylhomoserine aminocarboxypropyltransferase/cysteine synthase [Spirochaetia bacterium]